MWTRWSAAPSGSEGFGMGFFFGPVRYKKRLPSPPKKSSDRAFFQNHSQVVPAKIVGVGARRLMGSFRYFIPHSGGQSKVCHSAKTRPKTCLACIEHLAAAGEAVAD